jgi:broad specificity phosphatase PhoE
MKRLLLATAISLIAASSAYAQTVVIVRHAEKAGQGADPALSEAGEARARVLATTLADLHPQLILVTPLQRTALTAAPTAAFHGVVPEATPFGSGSGAHVEAIVARVRALPADASVLIVGHSNTAPLIARALGYADAADMPECEFDRMTTLRLSGGTAQVEVTRYGAPSDCPP